MRPGAHARRHGCTHRLRTFVQSQMAGRCLCLPFDGVAISPVGGVAAFARGRCGCIAFGAVWLHRPWRSVASPLLGRCGCIVRGQ
eukprot:15463979-Alexandrium_andersonii.AAC.1